MPVDPIEIENEEKKQRYDAYIKERDLFRNDSLTVSGRYDKAILLLGGGALALSITFLEKIAPHPHPLSFVVLGVAWLALIASILLQLHALSSSQTATNDEMEIADQEYRQYLVGLGDVHPLAAAVSLELMRSGVEERKSLTRRLNDWSRWLLTVGIFLLCVFSLANLPFHRHERGREQSSAEKGKSGYHCSQKEKDFMAGKPINESRGSYVAPKNALPPPKLTKPAASPSTPQTPAQPAAAPSTPSQAPAPQQASPSGS